jgi:hypothetical protein
MPPLWFKKGLLATRFAGAGHERPGCARLNFVSFFPLTGKTFAPTLLAMQRQVLVSGLSGLLRRSEKTNNKWSL